MAEEGKNTVVLKNVVQKQEAHINLGFEPDNNDLVTYPEMDSKGNTERPTLNSENIEGDHTERKVESKILFEDLEIEEDKTGCCSVMEKVRLLWSFLESFTAKRKRNIKTCIYILMAFLYIVYLSGAIYHYYQNGNPSHCEDNLSSNECFWCHGLGLLIIVSAIALLYILYVVLYPLLNKLVFAVARLSKRCLKELLNVANVEADDVMKGRYRSLIMNSLVVLLFLIFLIVDSSDDRRRLTSILGVVVIIVFGAVFSKHPEMIRWRHVMWGLCLQFVFGLLILRWNIGHNIFNCLGKKVKKI